MGINVNCIYTDKGAWCKNKKIKRSLFGFGARCCINYPYDNKECPYRIKYEKPKILPRSTEKTGGLNE